MTAHTALELATALVAVCVALSSFEYLLGWRQLGHDGVFSPTLIRAHRGGPSWFFSPRLAVLVFGMRAVAALVLITRHVPSLDVLILVFLLVSSVFVHRRTVYGFDGSDHMSQLVILGVLVARAFPGLENLSIWFIAGQAALSYCTAGIAKLRGRLWREGHAVALILSTRTYGFPWLGDLFVRFARVGRLVTWVTVVWEVMFPFALLHPRIAAVFMAFGATFHLANALLMGLNTFFWAFLATYPCLWVVALQIHHALVDP